MITFFAAQRTNCCNPGGQQFAVYLDGTLLGTFNPPLNGVYLEYSTAALITTTGSHTLKFVGLNPGGGDHTAFVDHVRITGSSVIGNGVQWLVSDHLGTPRMVIDQTGDLANITRHDYLPFGEEIFAGSAGRTTENGYAVGDGVRQQFTLKERDVETGLDYFLARYYSSTQGRFTSVDPENAGAEPENPQSWNGYTHTLNNPITNTDPDGLKVRICGTDGQCTSGGYDLSDEDWDRYFRKNKDIKLKDGKIYKGGEQIGTYTRLSFDDLNDFANGVIFGRGQTPGLTQRLVPVQQVVTVGAIIDVGLIAGVTIGIEMAGTRVAAGACFLPGTLVQTSDGGVPIEEIREGDRVLSYNEITNRPEYKTVLQTFVRHSQEILLIQFDGEDEVVGVTLEHPFYTRIHRARDQLSSDEDEWRSARQLSVGSEVKLASGTWARVLDIERRKGEFTVYNFEVTGNHNYFVGQIGLLVHNQCWMEIREAAKKLANDLLKAAKEAQRGTGLNLEKVVTLSCKPRGNCENFSRRTRRIGCRNSRK